MNNITQNENCVNIHTDLEKSFNEIATSLFNFLKLSNKRKRCEKISQLYYVAFKQTGIKNYLTKSNNIRACGTWLKYGLYEREGTYYRRLKNANFCRERLCPLCTNRLALKRAFILLDVLKQSRHKNKRFVFITLTQKNVYAAELKSELKKMSKALSTFNNSERDFFKKRFSGQLVKLEITYNRDSKTYHPHYHIMAECKPNYFEDKKLYISQDMLVSKWGRAMQLDYLPSCNIKAVKDGDIGSVFEVAKYTAKDSDYNVNADVLMVFDGALKGKRLFYPIGSFKDTIRDLGRDIDNIESENEDVKGPTEGNKEILEFVLKWNFKTRQYDIDVEKTGLYAREALKN